MRNLKKVLALSLSLVMLLGMMVMGSAATKDFVDANEIKNTEAVDVMNALGILEGDNYGNFNPTDILTREQAAKIICYMLMGPDNAELLDGTSNFTDVAATRWSSPFIAYCANLEILAGNGDGTFNPTGELTGTAFAKMLLVALGYDAQIEGYVNNKNWDTSIATDAIDAGINIKGIAMNAPLNRDNAAQMALNTLEADMVRYTNKGTTIEIDGVNVVVGASEAIVDTRIAKDNLGIEIDYNGNSAGELQFCEKHFGNLYQSTAASGTAAVNGKTGYFWHIIGNSDPVSAFVVTETVIASSADATPIAHAAAPSLTTYLTTNPRYVAGLADGGDGTATFNTDYTVYVNGTKVTATSTTTDYWWDDTVKTVKDGNNGDADINGNGVKVELIDTDRSPKTVEKIYFTVYTVETVDKAPVVKTLSTDGKDYIFVDFDGTDIGTSACNTVEAAEVFGYEGLAKDDVVTVVAMANGTYELSKITPVVGKASAKTVEYGMNNYTIDGKVVKQSAAADTTWTTLAAFNADVNFFYDAYGFGVFAVPVTVRSTDYVLITEAGDFGTTLVSNGNIARVVFDDGSMGQITVAAVGANTWKAGTLNASTKPSVNDIYSYTVNADGTYNLFTQTTIDGTANISNGVSSMTAAKGDNTTVYVVKHPVLNMYSVYTGYTNVPSLTSATWYAVNGLVGDGYADIVFVTAATPVSAFSNDTVYLLDTTFTTIYKADGTVDYYTAPAIVNGVQTTVELSSNDLTQYNASTNTDGLSTTATTVAAKNLFAVTYTDGKLAGNSMTALTSTGSGIIAGATTIAEASNGVVEIGSTGYNYTEDCVVYIIDATGKFVTVTDINGYADDITYTSITAVTASYGKYATATDAEKNLITEIYLQK